MAKDNPTADKPIKKARGGVASRKAKANSMAASAARSKGKSEKIQAPSSPSIEDESSRRALASSKAGDLSFVLNAPTRSPPGNAHRNTPSKSPNALARQHQQSSPPPSSPPPETETAAIIPEPPGFTPAEPAHNRNLYPYFNN